MPIQVLVFEKRESCMEWSAWDVKKKTRSKVTVYDATTLIPHLFEYLYDSDRKRICRCRPAPKWTRQASLAIFPARAPVDTFNETYYKVGGAVVPNLVRYWLARKERGKMHPDVLKRLAKDRPIEDVRKYVLAKNFEGLVHEVRGVDPIILREYCSDIVVVQQAHIMNELCIAMKRTRRVWVPENDVLLEWEPLLEDAGARLMQKGVVVVRGEGMDKEMAIAAFARKHDAFVESLTAQENISLGDLEFVHDATREPVSVNKLKKRPKHHFAFNTAASVDKFVDVEVVSITMVSCAYWRNDAWDVLASAALPPSNVVHTEFLQAAIRAIRASPEGIRSRSLVCTTDGFAGGGASNLTTTNSFTSRVSAVSQMHADFTSGSIVHAVAAIDYPNCYRVTGAKSGKGAMVTHLIAKEIVHASTTLAAHALHEEMAFIETGSYDLVVLIGNRETHGRYVSEAKRIAKSVKFICIGKVVQPL